MKVLFATYPMAFHTPGGGEAQLLAYSTALKSHGINVEFLDMWRPNFKSFDLVHYFSCVGGSHNFCDFVKSINKPLVVSSSLWIVPGTESEYPISDIKHQLNAADKVVTNSILESELLAKALNINRDKFKHVYNGYNRSILNICGGKEEIIKGMILNVGNIEKRKNQLGLARAVKNIPGTVLHLAGGVRDEAYLDLIMKELPGRVVYHGTLATNSIELIRLYKQCEVFALPSMLETPGLAAIEAYIAGAKIVITEVGSASEYFRNDVIYVNPIDVNLIEHGIRRAFNCGQVNKSAREKFIKNFEWNVVVSNLLNIYKEIVE